MLLEALLALTTVLPRIDAGIESARASTAARMAAVDWPALRLQSTPPSLPYFSTTARAVSNWRDEAGAALMPVSLALVAKYSGSDPAFVARCVKLNNYWCIKQARWSGELGGDAEGHTGFATAADGADAAASLLRRYYQDYGRRSALAIVRRWAPAECGVTRAAGRPAAAKGMTGLKVSADLAPRGIGNTVRARFLLSHPRGGAPRVAPARVAGQGALRVQPWSARARLAGHPRTASVTAARPLPAGKPVADIAAGILPARSEAAPKTSPSKAKLVHVGDGPTFPARSVPVTPVAFRSSRPAPIVGAVNPTALLASDRFVAESAALPSIAAGLPGGSLLDLRVPPPLCSNDETRIRNYAARIADGVGLKPDDDLVLFEPDGRPTARLAPVMLAMSSVELGSLRATRTLIAAAIARLTIRRTASTATDSSATR